MTEQRKERLYELVSEWFTDDHNLELMDPEEYQQARARNRCADQLEAILREDDART